MAVNKLRIIMILCFVTAFSAGVMAGKLWERSVVNAASGPIVIAPAPPPIPPAPANPPTPPAPDQGWLRDLNLTAEQSQKMRAIWSEVMKNGPMNHERRDALKKERDEAIKALLTDDQRKQQTAILTQFDAKNEEINRQMRTAQDAQRKQRDESLLKLFDAEHRKLYDAAMSAYAAKSEELSRETKKSFDDAVEKTRELLTPEQRVKYDDIRKKREEQPHRHFGPDWPRDGERHNGGGSRPDLHNNPGNR